MTPHARAAIVCALPAGFAFCYAWLEWSGRHCWHWGDPIIAIMVAAVVGLYFRVAGEIEIEELKERHNVALERQRLALTHRDRLADAYRMDLNKE